MDKFSINRGFHPNTNGKDETVAKWRLTSLGKSSTGDFPASHGADYEREQVAQVNLGIPMAVPSDASPSLQ